MTTQICNDASVTPHAAASDLPFLTRLRMVLATRRQSADLRALDDKALGDLGLTRDQVDAEVRRPAWDVPITWLR